MMYHGYLSVLLLSCLLSSCGAMQCSHTINGVNYDLSPLAGTINSVVPSTGSYNYYIAVCGAVQNDGCSSHGGDAMVCQVRKSPIEQFESVLAYSDDGHQPTPTWGPSQINPGAGVLLTFTNGDTCNLRTRTTIIDFNCDPTGLKPITVTENPQCQFNINYPTKVVCPATPPPPTPTPPPTTSCQQIVGNQFYDLTPLMGWDYQSPSDGYYNYYFSVCGVVQEAPCAGHNAVACQVNLSPQTWRNGLAYPIQGLVWRPSSGENGGVTVTYNNGDVCDTSNGRRFTTIFDFRCDPNATNMTITVLTAYCMYQFVITTNVACPQIPPPMTCKQTVDGVLYDLTPLQGHDISIVPSTGLYNYYIDVCGSAQACSKQGSAFACQVTKQMQFEAILAYSDTAHGAPEWTTSTNKNGGVTLTFTNGDKCDFHERKTIIDFQCDPDGTGTFSVIESPACVFHIVYPTPHVCQKKPPTIMPCSNTVNGVTYDLTPLSGVDSEVVPSIGFYNYYINVCGAVQAASCSTKGSAFMCQVRKSPIDQFEAVSAYSDPSHTPAPVWSSSQITPNAGVSLTFTNGDSCNLRSRTTIIDFNCDTSGKGVIQVTESPQCQFNVDYPTTVVCPKAPLFSSESESDPESSW